MSARLDVAGTGSMVVDRLCSTPRLIGADEKTLLVPDAEGRVVSERVGGVTLNHLGWARLFGLRVGIFGKQADDAEGRILRRGMAALGIETSLDLSGGASSFAQVYVDPTGGRAIYMARGATAELRPDEIDSRHAGMIASAEVVTTEISQVPLDTVVRVLEAAHAAGARTVLEVDVPLRDAVPGLGSEDQLHRALSAASVIKASRSALEGLADAREPADLAKQLEQRYATDTIVLTLGALGSGAFAGGKWSQVPAAEARVVDTTGAGDAFLGGWLAAGALGLDPEAALRLANACGAACCERLGGFPDDPAACLARALELHASLGGAPIDVPASGAAGTTGASAAVDDFLRIAGEELERARDALGGAEVAAAADLIREAAAAGGRVHVTGVGKPEHLAHYAASLLSSTGTPAVFLHGTEATHGSVGQLCSGDVLIAISNSGETRELLSAVEAARALGARILGVTGRADSSLGRASERLLVAGVEREGGPLDLAPRASMLALTLALQALSVELQSSSGFGREDYAARHPAGALGERSRKG